MYCPAESRLEKDNLFGLAIFHRHGLARQLPKPHRALRYSATVW
jgi:hypothetical protein